jgi:hypothetical protein
MYHTLQSRLAGIEVVAAAEQKLQAVALPNISLGRTGPLATVPDLVWSAALVVGAVLSLWWMKWWLWPFFLAAGALGLLYGLRPGVARNQRSLFFLLAGVIGMAALMSKGTYPGIGLVGALMLMGVAGRGVWGLMKEGLPGGDWVMLEGRRLTVLLSGLGACLLSAFFKWEGDRTFISRGIEKRGWITVDQSGHTLSDSTYWVPTVSSRTLEGDTGGGVLLWVLALGILLYVFRNRPWPLWARIAIVVCFLFAGTQGLSALVTFPSLGPLLFAAGFGAACWNLFTRNAAR